MYHIPRINLSHTDLHQSVQNQHRPNLILTSLYPNQYPNWQIILANTITDIANGEFRSFCIYFLGQYLWIFVTKLFPLRIAFKFPYLITVYLLFCQPFLLMLLSLHLKGVFSKPSGNCIVAPIFCLMSQRLQILATCLFLNFA